jgi:DNA polymerase-3 subunit delta'
MTTIVSHQENIAFLLNAATKNRVASAYLFTGRKGVGKFTVAKSFANTLTKNQMADIMVIEPTYTEDGEMLTVKEASEKGLNKKMKPVIRIEQIRNLDSFITRRPLGVGNDYDFSAKNVVIIDDCQDIKEDGMNALLKNLEEPGKHTVFILVASGKVSDTILSRCQVLNFGRLSKDDLLEIAKLNNTDIEENILNLCDGSYGDAIAIKTILNEVPEQIISSASTIPTKVIDCLQIARNISALNSDQQIVLMEHTVSVVWARYFNKDIVDIFSNSIDKLRAGMQPRLTLEALYLSLLIHI